MFQKTDQINIFVHHWFNLLIFISLILVSKTSECFLTLGYTISTLGGVQYYGVYHQYIGGVQYYGVYH